MLIRFDTMPERDMQTERLSRRTDRRTELLYQINIISHDRSVGSRCSGSTACVRNTCKVVVDFTSVELNWAFSVAGRTYIEQFTSVITSYQLTPTISQTAESMSVQADV